MRWFVVLATVLIAACGDGGNIDTVDDARALLDDGGAFETEEAGRSFARIADALLELGRDCIDEHGRDDPRCERDLAAAAFAQAFAPEALTCTQPGIDEARQGLDSYLAGADDVPQVPTCT